MIIYVYYVYMHILHTSSTSSYMTSGATQKPLAPSDLCDFFQVQDLTGLLAMLGHLATVRWMGWATQYIWETRELANMISVAIST
jgi:uncharacterized membrane protein